MFRSSTIDTITTGISAVTGFAFNVFNTAHPLIPGIMTSRVITSGFNRAAISSPAWPSAAVSTRNPSLHNDRIIKSRAFGSSSITRTVDPAAAGVSTACRPAAVGNNPLSAAGSWTSAGNVTVKVVPCPASLATVRSPPINRQNRRLMARPSPVPPYLRVVDASACENAWNNFDTCSGVIPIPVSATSKFIVEDVLLPDSASSFQMRRVMVPFSVNLLALLKRL